MNKKKIRRNKNKEICSTNQFDGQKNTQTHTHHHHTYNEQFYNRVTNHIASNRIEARKNCHTAQINSDHKFILCPFRNVRANKQTIETKPNIRRQKK